MARTPSGTRTASGTRSEASYGSTGTVDAYMLLEIGDFLLLENGDQIILDGITSPGGGSTSYRSYAGTRPVVI